jgi:magnesium-transporting ATPase (P-type)
VQMLDILHVQLAFVFILFLFSYPVWDGWCSAGGALVYKAQSQDEDALVQAAAQLQVLLCSKMGSVVEVSLLGEVLEFEILDTLEFTSERKRMSVVVRQCGTGALQLLTKGADETVFPILCSGMQSNAVSAFTIPTSFSSKLHKVGKGWYCVFGSLVS